MKIPQDRPGFRDLSNNLMLLWWAFVIIPPVVFIYSIAVGSVDPLGTALGAIVWLAATIGLVWFLRLPRRAKTD